MTRLRQVGRHSFSPLVHSGLTFLFLFLLGPVMVVAQSTAEQSNTAVDGHTPLALSPGSPAGSYGLSGFEDVNLYNGNLNLSLTLLGVGGRGGAAYPVTRPVSRRWIVERFYEEATEIYSYFPYENWEQWNDPGYGPGRLTPRYAGFGRKFCARPNTPTQYDFLYTQTLTRLTFAVPGGAEFELRDQQSNGQTYVVPGCPDNAYSRGTVFVTSDGTSATFISDTPISDALVMGEAGWMGDQVPLSGYLLLRDGTRYRIDEGNVTWLRDRNGNKLSFTYAAPGRPATITDSLNRQVTITYSTSGAAYDEIEFKGFGGTPRTIRINYTPLLSALRSGYSLQTPKQLFPELDGSASSNYNPTVIRSVTLPNAKSYTFYYNSYGELARVVLPTGGAIEYDYAAGLTNGNASGAVNFGSVVGGGLDWEIYRRVIERRTYANGTTLESKTTYSRPESDTGGTSGAAISTLGYVVMEQKDAAGTLLGRRKHYYYGSAADSLDNTGVAPALTYPGWKEGKEWKTEAFDDDGTTVLLSVQHTWQQPAAGTTWPLTSAETSDSAKSNDPHITQTVTTLADTNKVMKQTFGYNQYNNRTDVYEYNYGAGAAGPLVRRTHTDYLTTNVVGTTTFNYAADTAIHIRSLPAQISVYDAAGVEQARTAFEYDNYTATANHAALTARTLISGLDSTYTAAKKTRGNVTAATRYLLTGGTVIDSVSTYQQYDVAGNAVKDVDARGYITTVDFTDCFGAPDADAQMDSGVTELGTQRSYAFPTVVINQRGHATYTQRDYYTGLVVDAEDANEVTSSAYYNDALDRPTKIIRAANDTALHSQTVFAYDDTLRTITTTSDFDIYNDATPLKSQTLYDGLGRTIETRAFETATTFIATRESYDALGRVRQVSNPFRNGQTPAWTTTVYDALGRVTAVTTPDNAVVTTNYSGCTTTVTDQTGRSRQSTTDALGRRTEVIEDSAAGGLGYSTTYIYDALGNLRKVTQGSQTRYFMYDSLSRLTRAKHPEQSALASLALTDPVTGNGQWSLGFSYDDNGNLATRTDARNLISTYTYDELNRNTLVTYKSGSVVQARAEQTYDTAANGLGRLAAASYYVDTGANAGAHSQTAVNSYDALGRPLSQGQYFYANGSWGTPYVTQRTYNAAGALKSQTYPSGRVVTYAYDLAGRTSNFTGNLGDGVTRNYATTITYDAWGGLSRERFGTTVPLYHKERRNVRGQLYDMRLSTVNDADNWNRGAVINHYTAVNYGFGNSGTDNNGNLLFQQHWVPNDDALSTGQK